MGPARIVDILYLHRGIGEVAAPQETLASTIAPHCGRRAALSIGRRGGRRCESGSGRGGVREGYWGG